MSNDGTLSTRKASCILLTLNVLAMVFYTATLGSSSPQLQTLSGYEPDMVRRQLSVAMGEDMDDFVRAFDPVEKRITTADEIKEYKIQHDIDLSAPVIYFITPTYKRHTQMVDLIRLSQTLMNSRQAIYWIVIEDAYECSQRVRDLLDRTGLMYSHFAKHPPASPRGHRGIQQRNDALDLIVGLNTDGVVFFGDDDNAFDARLFDELARTTGVGIFGVGFTGHATYQRCVVDPDTGRVDHIATNWAPHRPFPMDMAGFAFHTSVLEEKKPRFRDEVRGGMLETHFLHQMVNKQSDLQALNDGCRRIYAWHTKTLPESEQPEELPPGDDFGPYITALL